MKRLLLAAGAVAMAGILFRESLATHAQVWLLLTQQLPQSPVKPLHAFTAPPTHDVVRFESALGPVVGDLFTPTDRVPGLGTPSAGRPALMLALGIPLRVDDRHYILEFADTLARLGYVVLWPRSTSLDAVEWKFEEPETFVASFQYLEKLASVDPGRISIFGVSIGASIAFVGAADVRIADRLRALIAFGPYYDLGDYLISLATRSARANGSEVAWEPGDDALDQARKVLAGVGQPEAAAILAAPADSETLTRLRSLAAVRLPALSRFNPAAHVHAFRATTFILHDQGDQYVPYGESLKLRRALPQQQVGAFLLSNLFQHARVREGLTGETIRDVVALYGFATAALGHL